MEISDLLGKLKGSESKPIPFLALELTDEIAAAAVWTVEDGKTVIVSMGTPIEWNGSKDDENELVKAVDATVSSAVEGLDVEPNQVIFGVTGTWADENGVTREKLTLLKAVCKELELKPLGFVMVTDSLLRYLRMQEGTPSTAILVQVALDTVTVSLVKQGAVVAAETIGRSDDISADVEEGLSRFQMGGLPSRILVFNSMHSLEEEVQNLISYDWKNKFDFLHIPKIESLPKDILLRSIAVAGGSEVAKAIGFDIVEHASIDQEVMGDDAAAHEQSNIVPADSTELEMLSAADFGFGAPEKKPLPDSSSREEKHTEKEDVKASRIILTPDPAADEVPAAFPHSVKKTSTLRAVGLPRLRKPKINLPSLPKIKIGTLGKPAALALLGAIVLIGGLISAVWLVPKATITVYVEPKDLPENIDITLSTSAVSVDTASATVPAAVIEREVADEESVPTSGTKTVGESAAGEVVIYNRTGAVKTFPKDTLLTAKSLKFSLAESVTVASKSAGVDYVDVPGKATAKIVARVIGEEGNLEAGTEFTIENYARDTYIAKNDKTLSGGSSRDVQVVSKSDKDGVKQTLIDKLREQGRTELTDELGGGTGVYVSADSSEIIEEEYSAEVGEEADSLTASIKMSVKGVSYRNQDVEQLMAEKIQSSIPTGYQRTQDLPIVELGDVKSENDEGIDVQAKITVKLLPVVDENTIKAAVRGVGAAAIEPSLTSVVGMKGASVEITPKWLPPRFKRMPRNLNNIAVDIQPAPSQ